MSITLSVKLLKCNGFIINSLQKFPSGNWKLERDMDHLGHPCIHISSKHLCNSFLVYFLFIYPIEKKKLYLCNFITRWTLSYKHYTWGALPKRSSGVDVHIKIRSTSSGSTFAIWRACFAASEANPANVSLPANELVSKHRRQFK